MASNEEREVELFKELLRFRTVSAEGPKGAYQACCEWLVKTCKELIPPLETTTVSPVPDKPIVVAKLAGADPSLEAVVLNSHYDVVPAMEEFWDVDPWAAVEKDGKIYGRGTQDMKCVVIQYILALARMYEATKAKAGGGEVPPLFQRTLYLTFVPDEEVGGKDGMGAFLESGEFERLCPNVGVALDEGLATPKEGTNTVFFGERHPGWFLVTAKGPTGHGSRFIKDTACEKLIKVANKALAKRREQEALLGYGAPASASSGAPEAAGCKHCEAKKLGDVLTINLTVLKAGVSSDGGNSFAMNVIPTEAVAGFDIRVPVSMPISELKAMLDEWTAEEGVSWQVDPKFGKFADFEHAVTSTDAATNKWWKAFSDACASARLEIVPEIFPAATDSRFLRRKGISVFGFSPMSGSPVLLHEHNEFLERATFLRGIAVYQTLVPALANL